MCAVRVPNATLLYLDDAAYSGQQIHHYITLGNMTIPESSDILVGLAYISGAAAKLLRPFSASIVKARTMPHVSADKVKSIPVIGIHERDAAYPDSEFSDDFMWNLVGADHAPCRTIFEHKVADAISLPSMLTRSLAEISYAAFTQAYSAYKKPNGRVVKVRPVKAPDAAALAERLGRRGLFSDAFCPMDERVNCFVPVYRKDEAFVLEPATKRKSKKPP